MARRRGRRNRRMSADDDTSGQPVVELGPPISDVPWSSELAQQSLEILVLTREDHQVVWLKPLHADSLFVGVPAAAAPATVVLDALARYDLVPRVVHSTSWRHDAGLLVLTYLAIVEPPSSLESDTLERVTVGRTDLARGDTTLPPREIGVLQVIEHALRHLSWLVVDDPVIAGALPDWRELLLRYQPEPFRALG